MTSIYLGTTTTADVDNHIILQQHCNEPKVSNSHLACVAFNTKRPPRDLWRVFVVD